MSTGSLIFNVVKTFEIAFSEAVDVSATIGTFGIKVPRFLSDEYA
jgi:hypothetical protein